MWVYLEALQAAARGLTPMMDWVSVVFASEQFGRLERTVDRLR